MVRYEFAEQWNIPCVVIQPGDTAEHVIKLSIEAEATYFDGEDTNYCVRFPDRPQELYTEEALRRSGFPKWYAARFLVSLDLLRDALAMPPKTNVFSVQDAGLGQVYFFVEHPDLPEVDRGSVPPEITPFVEMIHYKRPALWLQWHWSQGIPPEATSPEQVKQAVASQRASEYARAFVAGDLVPEGKRHLVAQNIQQIMIDIHAEAIEQAAQICETVPAGNRETVARAIRGLLLRDPEADDG